MQQCLGLYCKIGAPWCQRIERQQFIALYFSAVCCLAPALILAREKECKLGSRANWDLPKILEHSSKALDFLNSCDFGFVEKYVGLNHGKPEKMNPILETLKMYSPKDWEDLSEAAVRPDLKNENIREDLESCISHCNRQDEYADFFDESYEERLKDFEQKAVGSSKPDYTCPKCVQFLPANLLVNVPDVLWEL